MFSIATSLDILDGIVCKGRDPRDIGHHHQWGLAPTQFVPPYPSMGQGNWCQFLGAAQAPTNLQIGHMGPGDGSRSSVGLVGRDF